MTENIMMSYDRKKSIKISLYACTACIGRLNRGAGWEGVP